MSEKKIRFEKGEIVQVEEQFYHSHKANTDYRVKDVSSSLNAYSLEDLVTGKWQAVMVWDIIKKGVGADG